MKQLVKPYSLLFYFLTGIAFFFVGISYAGYVGAGKNQGLAAGAIVLGYGVISAFLAFLVALFIAYKVNRKTIITLSKILTFAIAAFYAYYTWNYHTNVKPKREKNKVKPLKSKQTTEIAIPLSKISAPLDAEPKTIDPLQVDHTGLGMFAPSFHGLKPLYFYGNINFEKSVQEHVPTDSISFKKREYGGYDIATAPPWLAPDHLKLDYDLLYFRAQTLTEDFIEVTVNTSTNKTAFVDRKSGKLLYWPEFLLRVNSVEFLSPSVQKVYARPFGTSSTITLEYDFMKPKKIKSNWMYVALLNHDFEKVGSGWIQWFADGKLLVRYNLLS